MYCKSIKLFRATWDVLGCSRQSHEAGRVNMGAVWDPHPLRWHELPLSPLWADSCKTNVRWKPFGQVWVLLKGNLMLRGRTFLLGHRTELTHLNGFQSTAGSPTSLAGSCWHVAMWLKPKWKRSAQPLLHLVCCHQNDIHETDCNCERARTNWTCKTSAGVCKGL